MGFLSSSRILNQRGGIHQQTPNGFGVSIQKLNAVVNCVHHRCWSVPSLSSLENFEGWIYRRATTATTATTVLGESISFDSPPNDIKVIVSGSRNQFVRDRRTLQLKHWMGSAKPSEWAWSRGFCADRSPCGKV